MGLGMVMARNTALVMERSTVPELALGGCYVGHH
jgi:hypothetical protein